MIMKNRLILTVFAKDVVEVEENNEEEENEMAKKDTVTKQITPSLFIYIYTAS